MKSAFEVREQIEKVEAAYSHVLDIKCATVFENAPRALMQTEAQSKLDVLYWVLGKSRPKYKCDAPPKERRS